jgi:hypothetical protein
MKRRSIGLILLCSLFAVGPALHAAPAYASPSKKAAKKKSKKGEDKVPTSAEIAKSMEDFKWGMSKDDVQSKLINGVKEKYRPLVAKTKDPVEEDRLRNAASDEMKRIRDSYVEFKGTSTGWDVSFLKGEFTHGNNESMMVQRDKNSQNFYFFINGKLWKWYKAFDAEVFKAGDFAAFAEAVQRRFGPAKDVSAELAPGSGNRHWLEWQDDNTRLRAVDQSDFYGFYCLVFEERATVNNLARLRSNSRPVASKQNSVIDAVTTPVDRDPDAQPDVVDRITGKSRGSRDNGAVAKGAKKGKEAAEPSAPTGVKTDDDPLRGLGL